MKENVIKLHDKKFKVMIPAAKIEEAVAGGGGITGRNGIRCFWGCSTARLCS